MPPLAICRHALEQILINLLANALDAVAGGAAARGPDSRALVPTAPRFVVVEVADNGSGIAKAVRPRLFETFFTTKGEEQGTGLGLAVSREMARSTGGDFALLDEPGALERAGRDGVPTDSAGFAGAVMPLAAALLALWGHHRARHPPPFGARHPAAVRAHFPPSRWRRPPATEVMSPDATDDSPADIKVVLTPARAQVVLGSVAEVHRHAGRDRATRGDVPARAGLRHRR